MSLPFASASCGLGGGVLYLLLFGAASWYGSILLVDASRDVVVEGEAVDVQVSQLVHAVAKIKRQNLENQR